MEEEMLSRTIKNDDTVDVFQLSTAECNYIGVETNKIRILSAVERAASKTKKRSGILVIASSGRTSSGLEGV